jgi:hypothetical protein
LVAADIKVDPLVDQRAGKTRGKRTLMLGQHVDGKMFRGLPGGKRPGTPVDAEQDQRRLERKRAEGADGEAEPLA